MNWVFRAFFWLGAKGERPEEKTKELIEGGIEPSPEKQKTVTNLKEKRVPPKCPKMGFRIWSHPQAFEGVWNSKG